MRRERLPFSLSLMLTRNAAKLAAREARRLRSREGLPWYLAIPATLFYAALALWMGASLLRLPKGFLWQQPWGRWILCGAAAGILLFAMFRLTPLYIVGHEMTHWLAAKLTGCPTGRIQLGLRKGFVEVQGGGGFVSLAPYVFPFYAVLWGGMVAFLSLLPLDYPAWARPAALALLGGAWAYHLVLTVYALRMGQSDLEFWGKIPSLAFILAGNLLFLFVLLALASPAPQDLWRIPWETLRESIRTLLAFLPQTP